MPARNSLKLIFTFTGTTRYNVTTHGTLIGVYCGRQSAPLTLIYFKRSISLLTLDPERKVEQNTKY